MTYEEAKHEFIDQPKMKLSASDTVEVKNMLEKYLGTLQAYDIDGALAMTKYIKGDSLVDTPQEELKKQKMVLNMFKGIKYELDYIAFHDDMDCAAQYTVTLFEKTDPKDTRPNMASFMLRPVRYKGKWYITLADSENKTIGPSKIPQVAGSKK